MVNARLPKTTDAIKLASLAEALVKDGDIAEAEAAADLASLANSQCFEAWMMLGLCRARLGKPASAATCYAKALELRPSDISCWTDLGECLIMMMDYQRAAAAFRQAIMLDPNAQHPSGLRARAVVGRTMALLRR